MIEKILPCINHSRRISILGVENKHYLSFSRGYNVLIGPNGSGKTTLLESIYSCKHCKIKQSKKNLIKYLSIESLNENTLFKTNPIIRAIIDSRATFSSEGQFAKESLSFQNYSGEDCLLIDTPETGLDYNEEKEISKLIKKLSLKNDIQIILATHSLRFIENADRIIEFEKSYLERMLESNNETVKNLRKFNPS